MTGFAGQKGTAQLVSDREEWLLGHFPASIVYAAKTLDRDYEPPEECVPEARVKISFGGVTAALWILGEKLQTGLAVDLRAVPIRQETVEICEELDLDPYELRGDGAWLIAVKDAEEAVLRCRILGIPAVKIGETTADTARVLTCGEIVRYLERA